MDVLQLLKELDGEVLANKARVKVGDKVEIIGRLIGDKWEPTELGAKLSLKHNTDKELKVKAPVKKPAAKKPAAKKPAAKKQTKNS